MTHEQIRDLLPDALHAAVDSEQRRQIEAHLRSCSDCASEMRVLQMVKDAPSFAPMIDAVKVSSRILPYGGAPAERARPKTRRWALLTAAAAVIVIGITVISRGSNSAAVPVAPARVAVAPSAATPRVTATQTKLDSAVGGAATRSTKSRELLVADGLDGLSDGSLTQLSNDLDALDGLPSAEPESIDVTEANAGSGGGQ